MKLLDGALLLSASDLVGHLNCRHLTHLELEAAHGRLARPHYHNPSLELLLERGEAHEKDYVEHLRQPADDVVHIEGGGISSAQFERTVAAMRAGANVIVQGVLQDGVWRGRTDILRRVERPSALGAWSYEVTDTKLARETKGGTILQLSLYSDLLARVQGLVPEYMYVVTPGSGFEPQTYRVADYAAYYRSVKRALEATLAKHAEIETYPEPQEHCEICRWAMQCDARRRRDDHLCLVAGITKIQTAELERRDIPTLTSFANIPLPLEWKPDRGVRQSYERLREQARVQLASRGLPKPIYETIAPAADLGLALLPEPSPGDIFFDLEGDPFVGDGGLEYLFGYVWLDDEGQERYEQVWAFTREEERLAFEHFIDFVTARRKQYPDLHVYHYAPYEPSTLKRLMGRYATREDELDRLLRGRVFVDLYAIVKQALRAGVESYSIKRLEPLYDFVRPVALKDARDALAALQSSLELGEARAIGDATKRTIAGYNRDDCVSARRLRDWLESIRTGLIDDGADIARPVPQDDAPSEALDERQRRVQALAERLRDGVPDDRLERTAEQHSRWIMSHTLDFHRREDKSVWWEYFRLAALSDEDLMEERCAIAGLEFVATVGGTKAAPVHRYRFPPQDTDLRGGETLHMPGEAPLGKVEAISFEQRTIDIKKRKDTAGAHPTAAFAHDIVKAKELEGALLRIGEDIADHGMDSTAKYVPARELLLRRRPAIGGEPMQRDGESPLDAAIRIVRKIERGVLPIQGPPGAGKTFTAARMICALVKDGKKVGITANSHKVIRNLLNEVAEAADESDLSLRCIQKVRDPEDDLPRLTFTTDNATALDAIKSSQCQVAAGTAWFWSREAASECVDVLFVDEAAQMALANVLAVSQACSTLVLLGDPQQLEQPTQGSHPEGTDVSALEHLLQGKSTIGPGEGLFLGETWRLHPDICTFTSELFYEGRLHPRPSLERQTVSSNGRVRGTGLRLLAIEHEGNQSSSPEEAIAIKELVDEILDSNARWTDRNGVESPIKLEDILIIAPYNAQVFELQERLPGARIGTVDKFQGQEAPIVIYSMTTSSHADAPRGMEFLYSLNRLNVATSRAKCICVLVASPKLFEPECRSPRQMQLANAFCRYLEMATRI